MNGLQDNNEGRLPPLRTCSQGRTSQAMQGKLSSLQLAVTFSSCVQLYLISIFFLQFFFLEFYFDGPFFESFLAIFFRLAFFLTDFPLSFFLLPIFPLSLRVLRFFFLLVGVQTIFFLKVIFLSIFLPCGRLFPTVYHSLTFSFLFRTRYLSMQTCVAEEYIQQIHLHVQPRPSLSSFSSPPILSNS